MTAANRLRLEQALVAVVLLGGWQLASGTLLSRDVIGAPTAVAALLARWFASGEIWPHLAVTLGEAAGGYLIGAVAGIAAGILLGLNPFLARTVNPVITAMYAVPKVSFAPLLIMAFGIHEASKVALTALIVFFFVFYDTFRGVRSVSDELRDVVAVMGASRWQMFRHVVWPTTLEWVIDGLKISVPYAFIGAVAGEIMISNRGIGFLIREHANNLDVNGIFAALAVLLVFSVLANHLVNRARRGAGRWRGEIV